MREDYEKALEMDREFRKHKHREELFSKMINMLNLRGDEIILDVGTGTGHLAEILSQKLPNGYIIGIDQSQAMLKVARENIVKKNLSNYYVLKSHAEDIIFKDSTFEIAFLVISLHHFRDPMLALNEIYRVLKRDGTLVLYEPLGPKDLKLREVLEEAFKAGHPYHRVFGEEDIIGMLTKAGFIEETSEKIILEFDQYGTEGIPMGPHYIHAYDLIAEKGDDDLLKKFRHELFEIKKEDDRIHLKGSLKFLLSFSKKMF
ncbi:MAG: class I SAM-dependent methyltransferase [Candidatus Hydrothermarchaeota archaeon]